MGKPKKRRTSAKKRKGSVVVRQKASVRTKRKKSEQPKDTLKKMDAQMPRSNGIVFKVKVKRK